MMLYLCIQVDFIEGIGCNNLTMKKLQDSFQEALVTIFNTTHRNDECFGLPSQVIGSSSVHLHTHLK